MTDAPYSLDFFQRVVNCQWGSRWIGPAAQYLAGGAVEHVNMSLTFPDLSGGTPGFTLMTDGTLPSHPSIFNPVTSDEVSATIKTAANRSMTGFARSFPGTPPPVKPGGTTFYFIKLDNNLPSTGNLRFRISLSGVVSGSWNIIGATFKDIKPGIPAGNFDSFSAVSVTGTTSHGDSPPALTTFSVNLETLEVTQV